MSDLALEERALTRGATDRVQPRLGLVSRGLVLCAAYYLGSVLGYLLVFPASYFSVLWPPNTVLLVALLLSPPRQWLGYLLVVYAVHVLAEGQHDVSFARATLYYVYDCALVLTTAAAMRHFGLTRFAPADLRQTLTFIAVTSAAVALATLVWSPLIVSLWLGGDLLTQWNLALLSNLLPFLIATPALMIGLTRGIAIVRQASWKQYLEFALLIVGLVACGIGMFTLQARTSWHPPALFYAPLPFLLWAAVRFGPGGLSISFLIFAVIEILSEVAGSGPFLAQSPADNILWLQIFLLALYVPLLVLASVVEERSGNECALRESEARYRGVVEDQTELICRFLPDGTYTFVNGAYCRYFQCSPEDLLGRTFWSFIPPEWHPRARQHLESITPEHPVASMEHEVLAPGDEIRWQQWRDRGLFDAQGRIVEYQAVGRDITERKRTEEAMQNLAHAARLAVVGELTGSIAHEINQPLGAILSNAEAAEMLLEAESPSLAEVRNILADIRKDDVRASEVIRRVRALLHKHEPLMLPLDFNELANEVVRLLSADARRRSVTLETDFAPGVLEIHGDRVRLQQVLLNLILNGMEAMVDTPEPRRVVVRTEKSEEAGARVSVIDAGHGIPSDKLARIFDSFFTTKQHGMGLGLAIARSIVTLHGGRLWASNNAGGGATLCFTVPLAGPGASRAIGPGRTAAARAP